MKWNDLGRGNGDRVLIVGFSIDLQRSLDGSSAEDGEGEEF